MKNLNYSLFIILFILMGIAGAAQVGINTDASAPDNSAMLDVKSTEKGFLPPRMTSAQRNAISNPVNGLVIFNTSLGCLDYYYNNAWHPMISDDLLAEDDVLNPVTGRIWKDRNLGASQVATSSSDAAAYGDLYQWGRASEGHESRTSGTTSTLATTAVPNDGNTWDGLFITSPPGNPIHWLATPDYNLWQGANGINNPCPCGFRLPTQAEWDAERLSWSSNDMAGAFASPLKLVAGGYSSFISGSTYGATSTGYYWGSTVIGTQSVRLQFNSSSAQVSTQGQNGGHSVRCIKAEQNLTPQALTVSFSGIMNMGETLTGTYTYDDFENDAEGTSTFAWYIADDENGTNSMAITGGIGLTYTVLLGDVGKYIAFEVTPVAQTGNTPGNAVLSDYQLVENAAPVASNVTYSGTLNVGETLSGSYTYSDLESDPEGTSTFQWYRADDDSGSNQTTISGATAQTYQLSIDDNEKYIAIEVTPVAQSGTSPGTAVLSAYQEVINLAPVASNVSFSGTLKVGQTLTGSYTYTDNEGDIEGASTYQWYQADDASGTNETQISGANSLTYELTFDNYDKYISFEVQPVAQTGTSPGTAEMSAYQGPIVNMEIGDYIFGGVVFYLDGSGGGMVCAITDQSTGAEWGCYGTELSGADGEVVGTGAQNTLDIVSGCTTANIAADICINLSLNGYNDWFLPSFYELQEIYYNRVTIDQTIVANGGDIFGSNVFWSSTEYNANAAWRVPFYQGGGLGSNKNGNSYVRAIRVFPEQNLAPSAYNVSFSGIVQIGETLTGSYTYADLESDPEGTSTFQWYRADDDSGSNQTSISGATAQTYQPTIDDNQKYIAFEVTPIAQSGTSPGTAVLSAYQEVGNQLPVASGVSFNGTLKVGQTLTGTYTYTDNEGDIEGTSTYQWYQADDASGTNEIQITGATSITYELTFDNFDKYISFEVQPVAQTGNSPGIAEMSTYQGPVLNLEVGDWYGGGVVYYFLQSGDIGYVPGESHGLICYKSSLGYGVTFWNGVYTTTGATATGFGVGQANTTAIITSQGTGSYAASNSDDLVGEGYDDWYLPSKDELVEMVTNRTVINATAQAHGGYGLANNGGLWSSSELISDNTKAWSVLATTPIASETVKEWGHRYHPIRSF